MTSTAQSIPNFEYGLAPGIAKTFIKELCIILDLYDMEGKDAVKAALRATLRKTSPSLTRRALPSSGRFLPSAPPP